MSQQRNEEISQRFGERLKSARGEATRADFARKLGLNTPQALENYEKGRVPDVFVLAEIARKLGLTIDGLLFSDQQDVVLGAALRETTAPYGTSADPALELLRALQSASASATLAGRTDLARALLNMIDGLEPAQKKEKPQ